MQSNVVPFADRREREYFAEEARAYLEHWKPHQLSGSYVAELVRRMIDLRQAHPQGDVNLEQTEGEADYDARFCYLHLD